MKRISEIIVVEGRYDKNTVAQAVNATVIETSGFSVFSDKQKLALLRRLADKRGLVILTDSDSAGFFIRGRLKGMLDGANVKHAYIPDVAGRERRKQAHSKEGKLGVEGMSREVIIAALERAGATFEDDTGEAGINEAGSEKEHDSNNGYNGLAHGIKKEENDSAHRTNEVETRSSPTTERITKSDLYSVGLSGTIGSAVKRRELLKRLDLPERLSANGLIDVLNALYTRDEFHAML